MMYTTRTEETFSTLPWFAIPVYEMVFVRHINLENGIQGKYLVTVRTHLRVKGVHSFTVGIIAMKTGSIPPSPPN